MEAKETLSTIEGSRGGDDDDPTTKSSDQHRHHHPDDEESAATAVVPDAARPLFFAMIYRKGWCQFLQLPLRTVSRESPLLLRWGPLQD
jgi:hypothetical protein